MLIIVQMLIDAPPDPFALRQLLAPVRDLQANCIFVILRAMRRLRFRVNADQTQFMSLNRNFSLNGRF